MSSTNKPDPADAFFKAADAAVAKSQSEYDKIFSSLKFVMHGGAIFDRTDTFLSTLNSLVANVIKSEGASKVNERQIQEIALDVAITQSATKAKDFRKAVAGEVEREYERVEPCFAVILTGLKRFNLGRVVLEDAALAAEALNKPEYGWRIEPNASPGLDISSQLAVIKMPAAVWRVRIKCFKGNARDVAAMHIDLALSLLRLFIPPPKRASYFPRIGMIEAEPTDPRSSRDLGITFGSKSISFGGSSLSGRYEITPKTFSKSYLDKINSIAHLLMAPPKNTVAERFANGLIWLARGRRATDRAERFLSFFTAMESLLTSTDKRAPVTDTICRGSACILEKDNRKRAVIAKKISDLYELRSKLVHAGERNVSHEDSAQLQIMAELVFHTVLKKANLQEKLELFHRGLKESSYGPRWP